jgi:hypothetical protein
MDQDENLRWAVRMHTRTVIALLDAVERADTSAQRIERLALIRDATIDFKDILFREFLKNST